MEKVPQQQNDSLFTCLSCSIAFYSAEDQREHYKSDHHRYNMRRRVAGLPPVSALVFNNKVLERRAETAVTVSPKGMACEVCRKSYTTENSYRSHLSSRKHKDNESKSLSTQKRPAVDEVVAGSASPEGPVATMPPIFQDGSEIASQPSPYVVLTVDEDATDEQINKTIDEKIAAARSRLSPTQCLFCPVASDSLEENLTHMSLAHSFFIPDADYLVNLPGLVTYLGEKIAVGNVCIYCNGKGREFRTLDAVRKHMLDKGHCKIAYDTDDDRLEISDFYDFTSSYPDVGKLRRTKAKNSENTGDTSGPAVPDEEWEDVEDDGMGADEIVEESDSDASESDSDLVDLPDNQMTYGDTEYELVLPSGARIGHRSMRRYYAQSFTRSPHGGKPEDPNSGAALVRRLLDDKHSALVPRKGGFGAFGSGTDVIKARNRGEAREAGRHVREFRDQRRREDFKTKVAFIHNHQKHYRDPLLQ